MGTARHGLVILAVLLVVTFSALVVLSVVSAGSVVRAHTDASSRRHEAEAMAWAGVQIALAELAEQRDDILAGGDPDFTQRAELYQTATGERAVVHLVEDRPADAFDSDRRTFEPLAGRINLNAASAAMLASIEGVSETQASRLVSERRRGPFATVAEAMARCEIDTPGLLEAACTVSCEPEVQSGSADPARAGSERIDITSDLPAFAEALSQVVRAEIAEPLRAALEDSPIDSASSLIDVLEAQDVPEDEWGRILDLARFSPDPIAFGRVDLLRASESVIACVPGIDQEAARRIVSTRDRLSDDERRSVVWPLTSGALAPDSFREALPWLTCRSVQFRLRVRAGFAPVDSDTSRSAAELRDAFQTDQLRSRVEWEVVLDAAEDPPRVAVIKDVTSERAWSLIETDRPDTGGPEENAADEIDDQAVARAVPGLSEPREPAPAPDAAQASPRVGRWLPSGGNS